MAYLDTDPEAKEKIASFAAKHSLSAEAVEELEGLVAGGGGGKLFGDGHRQRLLEMWGIENRSDFQQKRNKLSEMAPGF